MRIHVLSDLHLEGRGYIPKVKEQDMDLLILAGDISVGQGAAAWARYHYKNVPIIYVAGNHEYYKFYSNETLRAAIARSCEEFDVKFLDDASEIYALNGVDFIGGTMFTNFKGGLSYGVDTAIAKLAARDGINDFRISDMTVELYEKKFNTFFQNMNKLFSERKNNNKLCVVTHFAPCTTSIHATYLAPIHKNVNPYFVNDLDKFIAYECSDLYGFDIDLWVHGHVHNAFDYTHNNTRIVCNPRGYVHDYDNKFNNEKIVEI